MYIEVKLQSQQLTAFEDNGAIFLNTLVSTAKNGPGEIEDSHCTPRGWHRIRAKIGDQLPVNSVLMGRRSNGEIYSKELRNKQPERDWILTRILWLCGLEPGFNRFKNVDTMKRYIYIHGCPDDDEMGVESSAGCIKMRNRDLIRLFDHVDVGTLVYIAERDADIRGKIYE